MNETDIQTIMIDNKTINQRIENSLNVIFADIDITAAQGRVLMYIANSPEKIYSLPTCINVFASQSLRFPHLLKSLENRDI